MMNTGIHRYVASSYFSGNTGSGASLCSVETLTLPTRAIKIKRCSVQAGMQTCRIFM